MNDLLDIRNIHKRFLGVYALKGVSFNVRKGEIHALCGENGAGKSTLMKIISGVCEKDSGEMYFENQLFHPRSPRQALTMGISIIHQELAMMDNLTVAQNIFIGRESLQKNKILLDEKAQNKRAQQLLSDLHIHSIDPAALVGSLTVGKQQMVEIAKAVSFDLKLLILDEPTAALTETEIAELFSLMRNLAKRGVSMVYISHRMDEVNQIADRVTVMRDGEYIATKNVSDVSREDIISMMVGRIIYEKPKQKSAVRDDAPTVLEVQKLNAGKHVQNVSFSLRAGEILGFAGLMGAGRTETARAIFGADPIQSGIIKVDGQVVRIASPMNAVAFGIGYLSEDRKRFGLAVPMSVMENCLLGSYGRYKYGRIGLINKKRARAAVAEYVEKLQVKTPSIDQFVRNLSGGNQQKIVIAKWLINAAKILIFDEPTRGIDIGAKNEIYALINELARSGKSIILISSELSEIMRMSDRVLVMCEGRITAELDIENISQEKIIHYATMQCDEQKIQDQAEVV